jgi:hypothetical protein
MTAPAPATERQVAYIESLARQKAGTAEAECAVAFLATGHSLTKAQASGMIEALKAARVTPALTAIAGALWSVGYTALARPGTKVRGRYIGAAYSGTVREARLIGGRGWRHQIYVSLDAPVRVGYGEARTGLCIETTGTVVPASVEVVA